MTKSEPGTSVAKFLENLAVTDGVAKLVDVDGKDKNSGVVATGDILRIYSGTTLHASYAVLIYGDVNGDGKVSSIDLRMVQKHILEVSVVEGYKLTAADVNKDGKITAIDLRMAQKHILGRTAPLQ